MPDVFDTLEAPPKKDLFDEVAEPVPQGKPAPTFLPRSGTQADVEEMRQFASDYPQIPAIPQQKGKVAQIGAGLGNAAIGAANFMLSPAAPVTAVAPAFPTLSAVLFGAPMVYSGVRQVVEAPTLQGKVEGGANVALGSLVLGGAAGAKLEDVFFGKPKPTAEPPLTETPLTDAAVGAQEKPAIQPEIKAAEEPLPSDVPDIPVPPEALVPAPIEAAPAQVAKFTPLQSAWEKYDGTGEIETVRDLADHVDGLIAGGKAPEELQSAVDDYKDALEEDFKVYAGRGDMESAEQQFTNAVQKAAASGPPPPETPVTGQQEPGIAKPNETQVTTPTGAGTLAPDETGGTVLGQDNGAAAPNETQAPAQAETQTMAAPEGQVSTPDTTVGGTGIAQRVHEARTGEGKLGEIVPGEGVSAEEMITRGRELVSQGVNPDEVAARVNETKQVGADDVAVLRARMEELSKATNAAEDVMRQRPNDPAAKAAYEQAWKAETDWAQNAVKPAQTEWHKAGMAMQGETAIDTGTFTGLRRAFRDEKGREPTPKEQVKIQELSDETKAADTKVEKAKQAYDEVVKKEVGKRTPRGVDELREHFANRLKALLPC